jgi:hypothetical protein
MTAEQTQAVKRMRDLLTQVYEAFKAFASMHTGEKLGDDTDLGIAVSDSIREVERLIV